MNDKDKQLLEDFINYKDNDSAKYIVINKDNVSFINSDSDGVTVHINSFPNKIYYYEFSGNSAIGEVMKLVVEKYERDRNND